LYQDLWNDIDFDDFQNPNLQEDFAGKRGNTALMARVKRFSKWQLEDLSLFLPCIIGDAYFNTKQFALAVDSFLTGGDIHKAMDATKEAIFSFNLHHQDTESMLKIYSSWKSKKSFEQSIPEQSRTSVFLKLLDNPKAAAEMYKSFCMRDLGTEVIKFAVKHHSLKDTMLYEFDQHAFQTEVLFALKSERSDVDIISWFCDKRDLNSATSFFTSCIHKWTDEEFSNIILLFSLRPSLACHESERRKLYFVSVTLYLEKEQIGEAFRCSNLLLKSIKSAEKHGEALYELWRKGNTWEKFLQQQSKKASISQSELFILMRLFDNPGETSINELSREKCKKLLGKDLVKVAVLRSMSTKRMDSLQVLFQFDRVYFREFILQNLESVYREAPIEVAKWFQKNKDFLTAKQVVKKGLTHVTDGFPLMLCFTSHDSLDLFLREGILSDDDVLLAKECTQSPIKGNNLSKIFGKIIESLTVPIFTQWLEING